MRLPQIYEVRRSVVGERPITVVLMVMLLVANMVQAAKVFDPFWAGASRMAYGVQALIAMIYIAVAIRRQHFEIVVAALCLVAFLLFAHAVFIVNTHSRPNFNTIFTYMPLLTFVPLYESAMPIRQVLRIQLFVCAAYMVFYVAAYSTVLNIAGGSGAVLSSHDGGAGRVYLSAAYASFLALFAVRAKHYNPALRGALLGLSGLAIVMSGTRTFLAVLVLVLTFSAASLMNRSVRLAFLVLTGLIMVMILGGLVSSSWNPFLFLSSDSSASYRGMEYVFAIRAIQAHWLLGVGTAGDFNTLQAYLETPKYQPLYPADLGIVAPFFEFGLIGVIAFVAMTYFCLATAMISPEYEMQAMQLNCMTCAIYGVASPAMLFEPSSIFVMMLVAAWLRQRSRSPLLLPRRRIG